MRRAVATPRLASTLHVWVLGVTAVAAIAAALWMHWLLSTTDAPTVGRLAAAIGAGVAAGVARIRVRVGSNVVSFEWGESALLLELALLPNTWTPPVLAATFLIANLIGGRREPVKVVYNTAMWFLAATVAVGVAERFPSTDVFHPWGALAAVAAATTFSLTTRAFTSAVVAIAARRPFAQVFANGFRLSLLVAAGNVAAVFLVLALARWSPWSLAMLPPLLLAAHVTYRGTARAQKERDAWRGLADATQPLVGDDEMEVLREAAARALTFFNADNIAVQRVHADGATSEWDVFTPAGSAPEASSGPHYVQVDLPASAETLSALRLGFNAPVTLDAEEQQALQTLAHWLDGTLKQARLMAASVALADEMRGLAVHKAHLAAHDALTGLANRMTLLEAGEHALATRHDDAVVALMLIDLDHFKEVNDTLGHGAGDILLKIVAGRLRDCASPDALVARLGGDEFAVLLTGLSTPDAAYDEASRYSRALAIPAEVDSYRLAVEASVGFSCGPTDANTMSDLLRRADVALYQAKRAPDGIARYDREQDATSVDRLSLLPDVRTALNDGQIQLHYQPKYDMQTGIAIGAEALARWSHPERGMLPPNLWVPAVEQSMLIREFTEHVLDQAIRDCAGWPVATSVAVNLSARSLLDGELTATVARLLRRYGLPPDRLILEITETVMMSSLDTVERTLAGLRTLGVGLSVDDFGTGYSSLTFLAREAVDEIKIDRSFVTTMLESSESAAIVKSVIDLAQAFELIVVAEGVETPEQAHRLLELGCRFAQGFGLCIPVPNDVVIEHLLRGQPDECGLPQQRPVRQLTA